MFSLNDLLWALRLKEVPPITRLTAVFMADQFSWSSSDPEDFRDDEPDRHVDISKAAAWIGCEPSQVVAAATSLRDHGLRLFGVQNGTIVFRMPIEAPEQAESRLSPKSERQISIYVMSAGGVSKIGISAEPANRLYNLQCANPLMKLALEFQQSGPSSIIRKTEAEAHRRLGEHSIGNEWFSVPPKDAIAVVTAILAEGGP